MNYLWKSFFKVKYFRVGHLATSLRNLGGSRLWKAILKNFPEVYENFMSSFGMVMPPSSKIDNWLKYGPLANTSAWPHQTSL